MDQSMAALAWKLRRIAAGMRQQDIARRIGLSTTRYSGIERGEFTASELERHLIEATLPSLATSFKEIRKKESPPDSLSGGLFENST